jgi:hypothetical protein
MFHFYRQGVWIFVVVVVVVVVGKLGVELFNLVLPAYQCAILGKALIQRYAVQLPGCAHGIDWARILTIPVM